jgi:hypothetical protein
MLGKATTKTHPGISVEDIGQKRFLSLPLRTAIYIMAIDLSSWYKIRTYLF